jgi:hypothetical protein
MELLSCTHLSNLKKCNSGQKKDRQPKLTAYTYPYESVERRRAFLRSGMLRGGASPLK